jgi:hypothetical protein
MMNSSSRASHILREYNSSMPDIPLASFFLQTTNYVILDDECRRLGSTLSSKMMCFLRYETLRMRERERES